MLDLANNGEERTMGKRSTAAHRAKIIDEYRTSGLKQAEFARSKGIKLGTLQGWLYGTRRGRGAPAAAGQFIEVTSAPTRAVALLRIGAASLELGELPSPVWVAELLTALASR